MNYYLIYNSDGEITGLSSSNDQAEFSLTGSQVKLIDKATYEQLRKNKNGYLVGDELRLKPPRPSMYHFWNPQVKAWVLDAALQLQGETENVRATRDKLLLNSDWTDTLSAKERFGETLYNQWQSYRQALRDIPAQSGFPLNVDWPVPPS